MQFFDVVIIGAGPGGLKCAETLGNSPLKVLVLEKNEVIGPKVCAGGLTGKDIEILNLPSDIVEYSFNHVKLHVNHCTTTIKSKDNFGFTIDRHDFGQWQLHKLEAFPNIEVRTSSKVSEIAKEYVVVNGEQIGYKHLVGADGSNSMVRRYLGIEISQVNLCLQYIIPTDQYNEMEMFFKPKYFSAWYTWIFPHHGYVSIGCGANPKYLSGKALKDNFHRWLKERNIDVTNGRYEAFPMNTDYQGMNFGNAFLVGDAAGLASPFTGEGIYQALISGEEVAKTILDPSYESDKMSGILSKHARHQQHIDQLTNAGRFKTLILLAGQLAMKIPKYAQRGINSLA